jgi:hypothetical protein
LLAAEREQRLLAETLCQTSAAISSSLKGEEVLDRILKEMSRVVAHDAACVLLIEADFARVFRWRGYVRSGRATKTAMAHVKNKCNPIQPSPGNEFPGYQTTPGKPG